MSIRRNFLKRLFAFGLLGGGLALTSKADAKKSEKLFLHHVFFWLKESDDSEVRDKFEKALNEMGTIPSILLLHIGKPADTDREIIDSTYSYSFLVGFKDKAAHDQYQVHPIHDKFRNEFSDMWNKVLIYDSVNA